MTEISKGKKDLWEEKTEDDEDRMQKISRANARGQMSEAGGHKGKLPEISGQVSEGSKGKEQTEKL